MNPHLRVTVSDDLVPPSAEHRLLIAFCFGDAAKQCDHPAAVSLTLPPIDRGHVCESWWINDEVTYSRSGTTRLATCRDYTVAILEDDETESSDLATCTQQAYQNLLQALRTTRNTRLVKAWNYLGSINAGPGDEERYRQFSAGRALAFRESNIDDTHAPTGTGVGTVHDRGLTIIALSTNRQFQLAENPRQVSAFDYPRQYGPKSPKFGRAGCVAMENHHVHLISGTASIVGHESLHPCNTKLQLEETLRNLDVLCSTVTEAESDAARLALDEHCVLRVYLRDPDDFGETAARLRERLGPGADRVIYLQGEICRSELTVEIDGIRIQ